jgi:hypothetical protein
MAEWMGGVIQNDFNPMKNWKKNIDTNIYLLYCEFENKLIWPCNRPSNSNIALKNGGRDGLEKRNI